MVKSLYIRKMRYIVYRVKDNDGLTKDTTITLQVKSGAPSVTAAYCQRDTIWVKDTNKYKVKASDPNGTLKAVYVSWSGTSIAEDSIVLTGSVKTVDTVFSRAWDTVGGSKIARFWVRDNDSLMAVRDTTFTVNKGAPVLSGDKGDTLWVIINNGTGKPYPIKVNHSDPNGSIVGYFWNESESALGRRTTTDTIMRNISPGDLVVPFPIWIYGRDDDSLTRGGNFIVATDSAPPKPTIYTQGIVSGNAIINWAKKDAKDGNATQYKILLSRDNNPNEATDSVTTFLPGSSFTASDFPAYDFKFPVPLTPPAGQHGQYLYQIIAKDARGTKSYSDIGSFPY